jgi:protein required for attachment to host cells
MLRMKRTWVVVMDRMGARIFERLARKKDLSLLREWEHPGGDFLEQELTSDRPGIGRMNSREYRGNVYNPGSSAKEVSLKQFCRKVAHYLNACRLNSNQHAEGYDELILIAESHTLGILRSVLHEQVSRKVVSTLDKDFAWIETRDLPDIVLEYL